MLKLNKNIKNKKYNITNSYNLATFLYIKAQNNEDFDEILKYIFECEFDIEINPDSTINLIDTQNAYLGGVETYKNFIDIFTACARLESSFLYDYFNILI
jgi:hypothetical protein